ncbi:hypothetical protein LR48_Vigan03g021800 [Vigna angularis]|uniref:Uncharacterized protein n=1 Tax=Phaseolus angularis TaxID=3914 RepID=A0A0L9U2C9_PHAAN|nr:hypothetical protein LR48_Vigan03g021800 [Vigna angularis]
MDELEGMVKLAGTIGMNMIIRMDGLVGMEGMDQVGLYGQTDGMFRLDRLRDGHVDRLTRDGQACRFGQDGLDGRVDGMEGLTNLV